MSMSTDTAPTDTGHDVDTHDEHDHTISDKNYIFIALFLAVLTALEVASTEVSSFPDSLLIPTLLILMVIKFAMVILYFMHLKFDSKLFSMMFYIGLIFAVSLYGVMLTTFHFFTG